MNIQTLKNRDEFGNWCNENGLVGVGVEVGVLSGGNARQIMSQWQGQLLHLIDPWEKIDPAIYREKQEWPVDECYRLCQQLANDYPGRVMLHKAYSPAVASEFMDDTLDFVYIDGNHAYEAVLADMNGWWDKVKPGGLLCGHDFYSSDEGGSHCHVQEAVEHWKKYNRYVDFHYTPECGSWWISKLPPDSGSQYVA